MPLQAKIVVKDEFPETNVAIPRTVGVTPTVQLEATFSKLKAIYGLKLGPITCFNNY